MSSFARQSISVVPTTHARTVAAQPAWPGAYSGPVHPHPPPLVRQEFQEYLITDQPAVPGQPQPFLALRPFEIF
jgi:hypothetical protein